MNKLLQITTASVSGSVGRITEEIGLLAIFSGWDSYIAHGRGCLPSKSKLIRIGTKWDIYWHVLQTRLFDKHGFSSKRATRKFIKQIDLIEPDVVHLHNIHGYYLNISLLFSYLSKKNIPVVWTLHDCWSFTGHCTHFSFARCSRWKNSCFSCPQMNRYPASFGIDNSTVNWMKKKKAFTSLENLTIISVSDWLKSVVENSFLSKYPLQRIYNGVDIDVFTPSNTNNNSHKKKILLGVSNVWDERKGLFDYIELRKVLPDEKYDIVLVGLSNNQIKILPKGIKGICRTENVQELAELYRKADIVLNLSVEETFGLTTVEGLACGTPGIVYNCTATPELLTAKTGRVVEQRDIKEVVRAIEELMRCDQMELSHACRKRAVELYDKNARYKEYINLYDKLAEKR